MTLISLTDSGACQKFWQQRILINLEYWQEFVAHHANEVARLDREWETLVRGIALGLELTTGWPQTFQLIID